MLHFHKVFSRKISVSYQSGSKRLRVIKNSQQYGMINQKNILVSNGSFIIHRNFSILNNSMSSVLLNGSSNTWVAYNNQSFSSSTNLETNEVINAAIQSSDIAESTVSHTASFLPHHIVQDILTHLHDSVGLHWCLAIALTTVTFRLFTIPTYAMMRRFSIINQNNMPQQLKLQKEMMEAKASGDKFKISKVQLEYMEFLRSNNPLKAMIYQLPTAALFASMFWGLRGLSRIPEHSISTGGMLWFQNLSLCDPYYVLPCICCTSLFLIFRSGGGDSDLGPAASDPMFSKILMYTPFVIFPFILTQPSCIFVYWITNNMVTFTFLQIFKQKPVKNFFGIPEGIKHPKNSIPSFSDQFRNAFPGKKLKDQAYKRQLQHKQMIQHSKKNKD